MLIEIEIESFYPSFNLKFDTFSQLASLFVVLTFFRGLLKNTYPNNKFQGGFFCSPAISHIVFIHIAQKDDDCEQLSLEFLLIAMKLEYFLNGRLCNFS